jgi:hypothetical protein
MTNPAMKFFSKKGNSYIFTGDLLEIFINKKYEAEGYLWIGSKVKTIGVFEMLVNGSIELGLMLPSIIEICPDEVGTINRNGTEVVHLTLHKGSVFSTDSKFVEYGGIAEILFSEFVMRGKYPSFLKYDEIGFIWGSIGNITGVNYSSTQSIFEMMAAYMSRSKKDLSVPYRLTDRSQPPVYIGYFNVANLSESFSGRLNGAYARDGLNACLANASSTISPMEEALRT